MLRYLVQRTDDSVVEVAILPHKDGTGYSYINLSKGHICPCKFPSIDAAIMDMKENPKVKHYRRIGRGGGSYGGTIC